MMFYPMYFDPTYMLVLIGVVLSLIASGKVKSTFSKYANVRNSRGITGAEAAEQNSDRASAAPGRYLRCEN